MTHDERRHVEEMVASIARRNPVSDIALKDIAALRALLAAAEAGAQAEHMNQLLCDEHERTMRELKAAGYTESEIDATHGVRWLVAELARLRPLAEAGERMTWQPMETAPKDGAWILVDRKGCVDMARWYSDFCNKKPRPCWQYRRSASITHDRANPPIRWMQLPSLLALQPAERHEERSQ